MKSPDRRRFFSAKLPSLAIAAALVLTGASFTAGAAAYAEDDLPETQTAQPAEPNAPVVQQPTAEEPATTETESPETAPPAPAPQPSTPAPIPNATSETVPLGNDPVVSGAGAVRYESEPNNDRSRADVLPIGDVMQGALADRWDADYFRIDLPKAGRAKVQFTFPTSVSGNAFGLSVENSSGTHYAEFDTTGSDANGSRIAGFALFLPAGSSFIRIDSNSNEATIGKQYNLRVDSTAGNVETEFNDERATADPLLLGATILGSHADKWDADYFRIDLPKAGRAKIQFTFPASISGDAFGVSVENSSGTRYVEFDTTGSDANGSRIAGFALFLPAGPSFIRIDSNYNEATVGKQYNLRVDSSAGNVETEFNDERATADPLALGATIQGSLADRWDEDYFVLNSPKAGTGYVDFTFPSSLSGDTYGLRVLDAEGRYLASFDLNSSHADGSQVRRQRVSFPAGQFFIHIDSNYHDSVVGKAYALSFGQNLTTATPTISGTAKPGSTLTAKPGAWGPTPVAFTYQWLRDGKAISGATRSTYAVTQADRGTYLTVSVTGSKTGFTSQTRTSAKKLVPATYIDVLRSNVHFDGVEWMAREGYAKSGPSAPRYYPANATTRGAFATMLMRMNEPNYTPSSTLRLPFTDVRKTDTHYKGIAWMYERGYAAKAAKFNAGNPVTRGALATFMQRMKAPTYKPSPTLSLPYTDVSKSNVHYKGIAWMYQKGYAAKASKYNPQNSTTRGAMATFLYRMNGSGGTTPPPKPPQPKTLTTTTPTISGSSRVGATLTASVAPWGPAPVSLKYQWLRDGTAIPGATGPTYTVTAADARKTVQIRVTGSKTGYTSASRTSSAFAVSGNFGDRLVQNGTLPTNMYLESGNGRYRLVMQTDGNLVVYDNGRAIWANGKRATGAKLVMQSDGNLVEYGSSGAVWSTQTVGRGATHLIMQNDGNLVLYTAGGGAVWASR